MTKVERQLKELEDQKKKLLGALEKQKSNKQFRCGCGTMHRIKDCEAVQTHWYTEPHGCMGGDYWNRGELHVICPETGVRNRMMFSNYDVDWDRRTHYDENAEEQFIRAYSALFKSVTDEHKDGPEYSFWNNTYVDSNHEKFGLHVKSRNYKTYKENKR